jgi:Alpha/beta hydrolase of unknown function (DUF900)
MPIFEPRISLGQDSVTTNPDISYPFAVSTRNHFDNATGKLHQGHNSTDYDITNLPWNKSAACPPEVAIVTHGWGLNKKQSLERFDRVKMSLEHNGYDIPVIGFSWDANVLWPIAQSIAKDNGPKLAHLILNLKNACEQQEQHLKIRLIGHSLGARVVLSSLENLRNNAAWNSKNFKIDSVHLMGAAVDNEEVSNNGRDITLDASNWGTVKSVPYGQAVQEEVLKFYNLYNSEDNIFEPNAIYPFVPFQIYPSYEGDWALGQSGYQTVPYDILPSLPKNYVQINVKNEIPPICDADGDGSPDYPLFVNLLLVRGDNHGGYFGFRDSVNHTKLVDDGAINIVVDNWRNVTSGINQNLQLTALCK